MFNDLGTQNEQICGEIEVILKMSTFCDMAGWYNFWPYIRLKDTRDEIFNVLGTQNEQICDEIEVSLKMYTICDMAVWM